MCKNIFKKAIIIIILNLILLNVCAIHINANSNSNNKVINFRVEKPKNSDEIILIMDVNGIEDGALGMQGTLNFNHETLKLEDSNIRDDNWRITALNNDNGKFIAEINDESFFNTDEYLYSKNGFIKFKFKDLKSKHDYKITVTDIKFVDSTMQTVDVDDVEIKLKSTNWIIVLVVVILVVATFILFICKKNKRRKNEKT